MRSLFGAIVNYKNKYMFKSKKIVWDPLVKEWVKKGTKSPGLTSNAHIYEHWDFPSKGFGDTVFKLVFILRLNLLMDWMMNGFDCGCKTRRDTLNKLFPYKFKKKVWH